MMKHFQQINLNKDKTKYRKLRIDNCSVTDTVSAKYVTLRSYAATTTVTIFDEAINTCIAL